YFKNSRARVYVPPEDLGLLALGVYRPRRRVHKTFTATFVPSRASENCRLPLPLAKAIDSCKLIIEILLWRNSMKTSLRSFGLFALVLALFVPALADIIRLKDGNVIRGQVIGFKDQQFTVLVGSGAQGRRSRTLVYVEDVESIEFDSATTAAATGLSNDDTQASTQAPVYQSPRPAPQTDNRPPVL